MLAGVYNAVRDAVSDATPLNGPIDARGGLQRTTPDGLTLRRCATRDDFLQCAAVHQETWGPGFTDDVPVTILELARLLARLGARPVQSGRDVYGPDVGSAPPGADGDGPVPVVNPPAMDGAPAFTPADALGIPDHVHAVLRAAPDLARAWRASTRAAFAWCLGRGYAVTGFAAERGRGGAYALARGAGLR